MRKLGFVRFVDADFDPQSGPTKGRNPWSAEYRKRGGITLGGIDPAKAEFVDSVLARMRQPKVNTFNLAATRPSDSFMVGGK